jgi:hypothetical protein
MRRTLLLASVTLLVAGAAASARVSAPAPTPVGTATFVITGHGWGHGVGLSQYGAYGYAQKGFDYTKILLHYFPGTEIGAAPVSKVRVLLAGAAKSLKLGSDQDFRGRDASAHHRPGCLERRRTGGHRDALVHPAWHKDDVELNLAPEREHDLVLLRRESGQRKRDDDRARRERQQSVPARAVGQRVSCLARVGLPHRDGHAGSRARLPVGHASEQRRRGRLRDGSCRGKQDHQREQRD